MALPNIFSSEVADQTIARIQHLSPNSTPQWGKMDAGQMLAHCNVTYEMVYEKNHKKPNIILGLILKMFIKPTVVSETPYQHNSKTAPQFIMKNEKDFDKEKQRLIGYILKTVDLGASYFEQKESLSFGKLNATEWNNMFYKHLDHHLRQFGA